MKQHDQCADHCPQELDHERFFARGLPAPCGCTPGRVSSPTTQQ